ncbi:nebulin isoform X28 [Fundulus heteroclitus]|uniref:nebulin isoform X28 n=1 Tax=Fundulus heteroclitus TaxID=8078 RepID=UPI00165C8FE5|nr:nebulin isoform X28 [Fundulus heteroclitus]
MAETEEDYEEFEEEVEEEEFMEQITTTTFTTEQHSQSLQSGLPTRKVRRKVKVDTSKFMTPYLAHSQKMLELFSHNKYRHAYDVSRGTPPAITTDTPELIRIRKAQEQLSEVKYRMEGNKARTTSLYGGDARDIVHVKHVSELVSKVLYRQKWDETKDRYLLPPDAPELVLAVKNAANYSKKLYTEAWDEEKVLFYPYSDSPELRRVAKAQEVLSDVIYKKGHHERTAKYTSLADPPEVELARRVANQRSDLKYKEDYNKNVRGQWCETPYFDVAIARMAMDNLSDRKYTQHYENIKDQIYFMQTDTPVYDACKKARIAASEVQYKKEYEKTKAQCDYNTLPATENPLLRQLRYAGTILSDKVYKASYEKSRGFSINYCDTPKFQMDSVLKKFSDTRYKEKYDNQIKGHYIGSYEDLYMVHCQKVEEMKKEQLYKADYEDIKTRCFFPQTVTPEYEASKKLQQCADKVYRQHPDKVKFTQVVDSPVLVQASINAKQLSDLNYKAKFEQTKFKCNLPPDYPFFIQSRVNAFNLSDSCYKYDWEKSKAKKFEIKGDAIPILAARAHTNIASDVKYKKEYEKNRGQMIGALCINDDPKILHSVHVAKIQSDREYKKDYEKIKTKYHTPLDMISVTLAKNSQAIASMAGYRKINPNYFLPHDSVLLDLAKKANSIQSDNEYKADYNNYVKGSPWVPYGSMDVEKAKKAAEILNERKYRQHPDTIPFTSIDDHPIMLQAKVNQLQRSDLFYKRGLEEIHQKYSLPPDTPEFLQAKCNAYNISKNIYKYAWEEQIAKGYDLRPDAIPIVAAKAARHAVSNVQYKKAYEKARGHHVGFRSLQDDPLLVHYMAVAKMQSEKLYKKDYHKAKLKYHTPVDMMSVAHAKHATAVQTYAGYKQHHHNYFLLPDAMNLQLARNMNYNASDNNYKMDYETSVKGTGWVPIGSLDVEKAKAAAAALDERKYRQHPSTFKFTSITDSMNMELAKANAKILNEKDYKASGEKFMHTYHLPSDTPELMQARYNAVNISQNYYTYAHRQDILKGHHLKEDAIPILAAKSSRDIASNYKYKLAYEKARGHHVGFRSLQDDPLLVHYMQVAKMQSDKNYKKDYHKAKLKYHTPVDMMSVIHAKQASAVQTTVGYKKIPHSFLLLPDNLHLQLCRNMMEIQSDNVYKSEYNNYCKGTGWVPIGSLDVEKARTARAALDDRGYRQHPSSLKYTSKTDDMNMSLALANSKQMDKIAYKASGEKFMHTYHLPADSPEFLQAKFNAQTISESHYKHQWLEDIAKGYDMKPDAIPILHAKQGRHIASNVQYKKAYEQARGHHVGFRSLQDDPLLVHYMAVAKMQSEKLYKKDYHKAKLKYHTPVDMMSVIHAKQASAVQTMAGYRKIPHSHLLLPDNLHLQLCRNMNVLSSDVNYKSEWNNYIRGIGWVPIGSLGVETAKVGGEIQSERKYRQHPSNFKFSKLMDSMDLALATTNNQIMNKKAYTAAWEKDKLTIHIMPDSPDIVLAKANALTMSNKLYKADVVEMANKGYNLKADAIPIVAAKSGTTIASNYKYKLAYEKARGHHVGFRSLQDDPLLVHYMAVAKIQSEKLYKQDYHKAKLKYHTPVDMLSVIHAKQASNVQTMAGYRKIHHTNALLPDAMGLELARKMNFQSSDWNYKAEWNNYIRGIGWVPIGSLGVETAKVGGEILSEKKYRTHPSNFKFSKLMDSMDVALATANNQIMNKKAYTEAWDNDKINLHILPDTPEIMLAKQNKLNTSLKYYREGYVDTINKGYFLPKDAISVVAAKTSRDIVSDYKYKAGFRKQCGHHIGALSIKDDPMMMLAAHVAQISSDNIYKKEFNKTKTKYNLPVDMLTIELAKKCQQQVNDFNYRTHLHQWTCLPDSNDVVQARKIYDLQSDAVYKADLEWLRGCGWSPHESVDVVKVKHAQTVLNDRLYRQHPSTVKFTSVVDLPAIVLSKQNADNLSDRKYREVWDKDKLSIHIPPDIPAYELSKANAITISNKLYTQAWDDQKAKAFQIKEDAIAVLKAKASRDIISDYKYKEGYRKQVGHHIGARCVQDDPLIMLAMNSAKIASDALYKKDFNKSKTKFNLPVDMLTLELAKKCQTQVNDFNYRTYLHQWTCLPDSNDVVQARKAYDLQSDAVYKADMEWIKGCGWIPHECVDVVKVKHAQKILADRGYRVKLDTQKFTVPTDRVDLACAKNAAEVLNEAKYREAWQQEKLKYSLVDTPGLATAREVAKNVHPKLYTEAWDKVKATGFFMPPDAVPIKQCILTTQVQSKHKYLDGYRKQVGHHIGALSCQDDPLIVLALNSAKIASDVLYKKDFNKSKTKYNLPVDMLNLELAKKCQQQVNDFNYRTHLHQWTCLPDSNDVVQARKIYDLQSDNVYRADLEWIRGCGWVAADSVDHVKVRKAQEILNDRLYKKSAKEGFGKFSLIVDRPEIVLAKINAANLSDLKYKETFNAEKGHYIGSEDTPQLAHSREMAKTNSEKLYKLQWDSTKATSYSLNHEYIPLLSGKQGREIASDVKYKDSHEKAKGHYMAGTLVDFPEVMRCGQQEKNKALRVYQKDYHQTKTKIHLPPDIIANQVAKRCQDMLSDVLYRTHLHQWTCHPEQEDAIRARKTNEILSDVFYKDDLNWMKGIGCYVWDTPEILRAKKSYELQSDLKYRADAKKEFNNYSIVTDTPEYVTAVLGHTWASDLNYREAYHKEKHMYTTVLDTHDYARCHNFKFFFSNKNYTAAWDKIKAKGYQIPADAHALQHAKQQKVILSNVKYKEDYEKFKSLYSLPKSLEDDPATARCVKAGKLVLDRLYKENYEKTKAKNHIPPDMLEIMSARNTQSTVSGIHYRKYLHQWICMPDMQMYVQARKVNEQLSDIFYKDDLNWLKGIGCYAWDTPEILRVKNAGVLQSESKYRAKGIEAFKDYTVVTDTPVYETAKLNAQNLSDLHYRFDYNTNVKGKHASPAVTVETERARQANYIQSDNWYKEANKNSMPTGYTLPSDTPLIKQAKMNSVVTSNVKYKEAFEMVKAKAYTLHPEGVNFVTARKAHHIINDRLYRETYHKQKDKIHTTYDTPEVKQVKMNQQNLSDLFYREKYYNSRGQLISMPITPQLMHCRHVNEITSELRYKEDLMWLRGVGCFLYDTPEMVHVRNITKFKTSYPVDAKKNLSNYTVVLDTPEYNRVTELKTHMSDRIYRAQSRKDMAKVSSIADSLDIKRVKWAQQLTNKYQYTDLASKERAHFTPETNTPNIQHARKMKVVYSETKYKEQYEKMKHRYTAIADTPMLIRSKKAYLQSSDLRYKETFELSKGHYHTNKDALDIVCHRKFTDDISEVKYREKYINSLGTWKSIPDRPEFFFSKIAGDNVSNVKYKEDLEWLKGIGCYVWDTPDLQMADRNKSLYSERLYKASFEKNRGNFKYTCDSPFFEAARNASVLINDKMYKSRAKDLLKNGCNELLRPDILTALCQSIMGSKWKYREQYERAKDKFTSVLETPEYEAHKRSKKITDVIYKMEHNKTKAKGYTLPYDTPHQQHMKKVKEITSNLKYKEVYEKSKAQINMDPEAHEIRAAKEAYKNISNLDYKKKYEATKNKWIWTADRPDFLNAAKNSMQQSDVEYKYDKEMMKGCVIPVVDDKYTLLCMKNAEMASDVKYKEKYEKSKGHYIPVMDTPQILHAKAVRTLVSESKYKQESKKAMQSSSFTKLAETRDTAHSKEVKKLVSQKQYKQKFEKEKGKSVYNQMMVPPDVQHAMDVAKSQSNIAYKKDAKANLHYTTVADRPDIRKATQAAKLISDIGYREKAREEASRGGSLVNRPDIALATHVSQLTSQVEATASLHGAASYDTPLMRHIKKMSAVTSDLKYKEKFDKEMKGKKPQFDPKESKIYKTQKDANDLASEVKYKGDLKKIHKPVTDMAESLSMQHNLSTSKLSSDYRYKKKFEESKGHYHMIADTPEQLHLKEASELQSNVKYKEKYEKEKGKPMLDFETPTYVTAKEAQHMQSQKDYKRDFEENVRGKNLSGLEVTPAMIHVRHATKIASEKEYRKDLEEGVKGKGLTVLEETPELLRAKNATQILCEREYKKSLEQEIKGKGMLALATDTPDFMRARNATDILSQTKYKQTAEMDRASYTTVIDTPDIIHAQQMRNIVSQKKYREEAEKTMSHYVPVLDTPEMQRVRENQRNFSTLQYQIDLKNTKGKVSTVKDTPEMLRVKENTKNFSLIHYKDDVGGGTALSETPEMERVKRNQRNISTIQYKESVGQGTTIPDLPEVKRVRETQKNISLHRYKEGVGQGTSVPETPEMERVKRNQENISTIKYKDSLGRGTAIPDLPEVKRVKETQKHISSVLYKDSSAKGTPVVFTPEMERVKRNQENISSVLYSDSFRRQVQGKAAFVLDTPEMRRVRETQRIISGVKYHEDFEKSKGSFTPTTSDLVTERVKKNTQDFSDISYRGIQRRVVEMEKRRAMEHDQETVTDLRVWRTNPGSVFDYDPAEDNIQSRSLHMMSVQAQRRSKEHSRSTSALSGMADEKSEVSQDVDHHLSLYSNGFMASSMGYQQTKTVELQQRSSSVATQQTTVSSIPSHPSTTGKTVRAMYDYTAADSDEVSFKDGDVIVNVQSIDEGWMYGTVQRSGKTGMLPANYVEAI